MAVRAPSAELPATQDDVFARSEGDQWFLRNKAALERFDPALDVPLQLIQRHGLAPRTALEIGAANGYRLAALAQRTGAHVTAVEPSPAAIADGRKRFAAVEFVQGQAHAIPLAGPFDLVIVNFVLHWVDRSTLVRAIAEIDRLTAKDGHVVIGDFYPARPTRVPYHHLPGQGLYTYKQDYAAPFLASGLYELVELVAADHRSKRPTDAAPESERIGIWLLRKTADEGYVTGARPAS